MQAVLSNPKRVQSPGKEIANSISRGVGLTGALVGTPFLVLHAVRYGDAGFIAGTSVFSASMILLYLASALYHARPIGKAKRCFRIIEHSAIFIYCRHLHAFKMIKIFPHCSREAHDASIKVLDEASFPDPEHSGRRLSKTTIQSS